MEDNNKQRVQEEQNKRLDKTEKMSSEILKRSLLYSIENVKKEVEEKKKKEDREEER